MSVRASATGAHDVNRVTRVILSGWKGRYKIVSTKETWLTVVSPNRRAARGENEFWTFQAVNNDGVLMGHSNMKTSADAQGCLLVKMPSFLQVVSHYQDGHTITIEVTRTS